nr:MAG TPA: hypothetical protein [Caudoviricetes sp.]
MRSALRRTISWILPGIPSRLEVFVSLSESVFIGRSASGYTTTPELPKYTKVHINVDDESFYEAGNGDNVLELECPWGSQQMANDILESIGEFVYRPYDTDWAKLDPSAELGDGVTINGLFSGIYVNETNFSTLMAARISAPQENAVDHEYPYKSPTDRKTTRQFAETRASLRVNAASIQAEVTARTKGESEMRAALELHAQEIAARVTQTGGNSASFGWSLTAEGFVLESSGQEVFKATKDGVDITGKVTATAGFIGGKNKGFTITENAIYNALSSLYGTVNGVYIGTDGIALGGGKFRVNSNGQLYATDGTFTGNVYANRIQTGGDAGSIQGSQIGAGTITTANTNGYLNGGIANGYFAGDVFSGAATAAAMNASAGSFSTNKAFRLYGKTVVDSSYTFTVNGVTHQIEGLRLI